MSNDRQTIWLVSGVVAFLFLATVIGQILAQNGEERSECKVVVNLNARIWAWWIIVVIFGASALSWSHWHHRVVCGSMSFNRVARVHHPHAIKAWRSPLSFLGVLHPPPDSIHSHRRGSGTGMIQYFQFPVYTFLFIPIRSVLGGGHRTIANRAHGKNSVGPDGVRLFC